MEFIKYTLWKSNVSFMDTAKVKLKERSKQLLKLDGWSAEDVSTCKDSCCKWWCLQCFVLALYKFR